MEHKFYKQALQAHYWNSFSPAKRAESDCQFYDELKAKIENGEHVDKAAMLEKLDSKFSAWLSAKSRTASPMVTGPARFPVERNRKALDSEMKRYIMKTINKMIREKKTAEDIVLAFPKIKLETAQNLLGKDCMGYIGFAPFKLTNNNAKIKRIKDQIASLESTLKNTDEQAEIAFEGVKVFKNKEEDRIQLYFDTKPAPDLISKLKSLALKWSPSRGCWQRQLTANAINTVMPFIKSNFKESEAL